MSDIQDRTTVKDGFRTMMRGFPTGVVGYADNARAVNALGPVVAAYRTRPG